MTDAIIGYGTLFQNSLGGIPETWETVAETLDLNLPTLARDSIDVSQGNAPGEWREFIPGMKDAGEVTINLNFTQAAYSALFGELAEPLVKRRVLFSNGSHLEFYAFLIGLDNPITIGDRIITTAKFKVSGTPVFHVVEAADAPIFGIVADRVNMLHPCLLADTASTSNGVYVNVSADYVADWVPGGVDASPNDDYITFGGTIPAPRAGDPATKIIESTINGEHFLLAGFSEFTSWAGTTVCKYRLSVYAKAAERSRIVLALTDSAATRYPNATTYGGVKAVFDLLSGTIAVPLTKVGIGFLPGTASITGIGDGWYRCTISGIAGIWLQPDPFTVQARLSIDSGFGTAAESSTYTGNGTSGLYVWRSNCLHERAFEITERKFFDDFDNDSTIDNNDTRVAGFNWYRRNAFPGFHAATPVTLAAPTGYSIANSILTLDNDVSGYGSSLLTVCWQGAGVGDEDNTNYVGQTWGLPAMFEGRAAWDPSLYTTASAPPVPAFWQTSIEGMIAKGVTGAGFEFPPSVPCREHDFFEALWSGGTASLVGEPINSIHSIYPSGRVTIGGFAAWPFELVNYDSNFHTFNNIIIPPTVSSYTTYSAGQRNVLPNSAFTGTVAGSPDVWPSGLTVTIAGTGTIAVDIISYADNKITYRITGTPTGQQFVVFTFDLIDALGTIAQDQIWCFSIHLLLVDGTAGNPTPSTTQIRMEEHVTAGAISAATTSQSIAVPEQDLGGTSTRFVMVKRVLDSTTESIECIYQHIFNNGVTYDQTYEVYHPQLERGILPTPVQASAGTEVAGEEGIREEEANGHFGIYSVYWDGIQIPHAFRWGHSIANGDGTQGDSQHYPIIIGCGVDWPCQFDWISVYGATE